MNDAQRLERARLLIVLSTVVINVVAVIIFSFMPWSDWRTGLGLNLVDNLLLIAFAIRYRDKVLGHLLLFGVALGFAELPADAYLVDATKTLDYSLGGGPMLWRSPIWMPFAWEIVAVQFGTIGMYLYERWGSAGLLATAIIGAINIPFYEEMALRTNWWRYVNCKMFLHTPYYIIVGEFGIAMAIAMLARLTRRTNLAITILAGAIAGLLIFPFYALPYWMIDRLL